MSPAQKLRLFVTERLNEVLVEILDVIDKSIAKYEQEATLSREVIARQHALLCSLNKPEQPSSDSLTQQFLGSTGVSSEGQDQTQVPDPQSDLEPKMPHLDEAEIIQFTYSRNSAARPEAGPEGPDQDVLYVSSETEDSDDYNKESDSRSALKQPKPKRGRRARSDLGCRVCHLSFRSHNALLQHAKVHLQEGGPACGLCGGRFDSAERLTLHLETHQTEMPTRSESKETSPQRSSVPDTHRDTHTCGECGRSFVQLCRLRKHKCLREKVHPKA
ncbi:zinc finger protein 835-like [Takifugu rubripes]|uniref:zinc finger protein 835-like n=1 Tax=Takifugu rubripes TaxID=31033 RepID=UPI001145A168|nr:zinc finger protein 835-like [Takifugu rubripes]